MVRILPSIFAGLVFISIPNMVFALSVSPAIINLDAVPKDKIERTIRLTNDSGGSAKLGVYTFVWDLDKHTGVRTLPEQNKLPLHDSLAQWIAVSRGPIELAPGETKELPLTIKVNLRAKTNDYHAMISFAPGSSRDEAARRMLAGQGVDLLVNADVVEDVKETLQLNYFAPKKSMVLGAAAVLSLEVENIGERTLTPSGEIHITNRQGKEVAVLPVNTESVSVEPDELKTITVPWEADQTGRYKAFLELSYGSERATITDSTFVTFVPLRIAIAIVMLIFALVLWRYFRRRRFEDDDYYYDEPEDLYEPDEGPRRPPPYYDPQKGYGAPKDIPRSRIQ